MNEKARSSEGIQPERSPAAIPWTRETATWRRRRAVCFVAQRQCRAGEYRLALFEISVPKGARMFALIVVAALGQSERSLSHGSLPFVDQTVECVSVAHLGDGVELAFFWSFVQGEWTCLDHRWVTTAMSLSRRGDEWLLAWADENESCYRLVRTKCWVESWEHDNPLIEQNQRPWFRQLLHPGLRQPPR
jgi:hypothetical protein